MTTGRAEPDDLAELLGRLRDGLLDGEGMMQLDDLLASDPTARRYYLEYIHLYAALRHYQGVSGGPQGLPLGSGPGGDPEKGRRFRLRIIAVEVAAAVVVAAVLVRLLLPGGGGETPARGGRPKLAQGLARNDDRAARAVPKPISAAPNVAVLTRGVDPVWGPMKLPTAIGSALSTGTIVLKSGLIQLEFYGGAIVVLEGPADLDLLATDRAYCRQGKLRIRAPLQSSHFSLATPEADVVDLGTEFGISVDQQRGSEVQVFEGSVALQGNGQASPMGRQLLSGEGLRINTTGASSATKIDPRSFVGTQELERLSSTEAGLRYRAWRAFAQRIENDPRVIAYYSFEDQQRWERTLRDRSAKSGSGPRYDGGIVGSEWAEGRWPQKLALDFKRVSDRVRINIPGEFTTLTLMTWVRVDDYDHRLNSLLLADGWNIPGEVHWELNGKGSVSFALKNGSPPGNLIFESPVVLGPARLGLWTHVATVFDPPHGSITTYVNSRPVARHAVQRDRTANIGWANIGNWSNPPPNEPVDVFLRNLNGRIDEFILFNAALDESEIGAIYEVGKPNL